MLAFGISLLDDGFARLGTKSTQTALDFHAKSLEESISAARDQGFDLAVSNAFDEGDKVAWLTKFVPAGGPAPDDCPDPRVTRWTVYRCAPTE